MERLALHSTKGELWDKALEYAHQAGIKAAEHSAHRQAVAYFEQALEVLARQPRSREMAERAIDLRLDFRNSLHALGDLERILEHLREAEALATALDDQRRLGQVFAFMTQYFRMTGEPDRAIESGEKALDIARWQPNSTLWIVATMFLGSAHAAVGNYRKAAEMLSHTVASMPEQLIHHNWSVNGLLPVFTRAYLGYFLAELGSSRRASGTRRRRCARPGPPTSRTASSSRAAGRARSTCSRGSWINAVEVLEQGLSLCRSANLPVALPVLAASLGPAYALPGRSSDAIRLLEQAVDQARAMKRAGGHALLLLQLGDALPARRTDHRRERHRAARAGPGPHPQGARARGLRPAPPGRHRGAGPGRRARRRGIALLPGARPGGGARHATPRRPLPARPGTAARADGAPHPRGGEPGRRAWRASPASGCPTGSRRRRPS